MRKEIKIIIVVFTLCIILGISNIILKEKNENNNSPEKIAGFLAERYYKDNIYDKLSNPKEVVEKYNKIGFNFSLYDLLNTYEIEKYDIFKDNKCDYENAQVFIYPYEPYSKEDYNVKVVMECEK